MVSALMSPKHPALPSEQHAEAPELATLAAEDIERPLQSGPQTYFLGGLLALAVLAAVYVASSIILPVALAFVLQLILQPAVRLLERVRVPRAIGALLAILLVIGTRGFCRSLVRAGRDVGRNIGGGRDSPSPIWCITASNKRLKVIDSGWLSLNLL